MFEISEALSERMSDRTQKICQKECQKECQKICQKESKTHINKMSEKMWRCFYAGAHLLIFEHLLTSWKPKLLPHWNACRIGLYMIYCKFPNILKTSYSAFGFNRKSAERSGRLKHGWSSLEVYWYTWTCAIIVHKFLISLQVVYCHVWSRFIQTCLTDGILTCFRMFDMFSHVWQMVSCQNIVLCLLKYFSQVVLLCFGLSSENALSGTLPCLLFGA